MVPASPASLPARREAPAASAVAPAMVPVSPAPLASMPTSGPSASTPLAAAPRAGGKVARFIPAEAAQSKLKPADDGKLPGLRLHETADGSRKEKTQGTNPLVLVALLSLSVVMTVVILFWDVEPNDGSSENDKAVARSQIGENYFADLGNQALKPYQVYLRNAQQAHVRGDAKAEREMYHKVLKLLRAERQPGESLTGTLQRDRDLEEYLTTLLR